MPRILPAVIAILLQVPVAAQAVFVPPELVIRKLSQDETRGRSATEAVWERPACIPYLAHYKGSITPTQQTEVRLAYDDHNLYIAFRCMESRIDRLVTDYAKRDDKIWRDDSVSVLLDTRHDHRGFFHLTANAAGARYDEKDAVGSAESWDGNWSVNIGKDKTEWRALIIVPFAELGLTTPKPGTVWGANFGRHERPSEELSCWSPVIESFHEPPRWGHIRFGGTDSPIITISAPEISSPGSHPVTVRISNLASAKLRLRAVTMYDGTPAAGADFAASRGESTCRISLSFPKEGKHFLSISVKDSASGLVHFRTPPIRVNVPANLSRLARHKAVVSGRPLASKSAEKERVVLREELRRLETFARNSLGDNSRWLELGRKLDAIEPRVEHVRFARADPRSVGYVLGVETSLRKILRDKTFEGKLGAPARISLCRNEYEAVQAVIIAYGRELRDVSVSITALAGPGGAIIPAERVRLDLVGYVKTRQPRYEVDHVGWYPDPLMELAPFDLTKGAMQPIWVTVHAPKEIPAGIYRGNIKVRPANAPESTLALEVGVWNVTLPEETHLKTAFALFPHEIGAWYGQYTDEMRRDWYQFLLEHRINPTNIYSSTPLPEMQDLEFCITRGLNAFNLAYVHNFGPERRAELVRMINEYRTFLRERGWWDRAYIYGFDEVRPEKYPELRDMYGFIKDQFPDLHRVCTVVPNKDLKGYVDIWVPVTSSFRPEAADEYRKSGDEVWWYVCCNPQHPYANFFIDYPAIDPRIIFWMNWKYRVTGFLYYALNLWETNRSNVEQPGEKRPHEDPAVRQAIREGKRWPEIPWNTFTFDSFNGDGHLIYPGPSGKPWSSIRFECIRDGIEDYELFYLLNELVERAGSKADPSLLGRAREVLSVRSSVVRSLTDYTLEPEVLLKGRREVVEIIEELEASLVKYGGS